MRLSILKSSKRKRSTSGTRTRATARYLYPALGNVHRGLSTALLLWMLLGQTLLLVVGGFASGSGASSSSTSGDGCSSKCICKWKGGKQTAECVSRSLQKLPSDLPSETQVLDASGNDLRSLPSTLFQNLRLTNLQKLHLRACRIESVDTFAFQGLTNLVELDLSRNQLKSVPGRCLAAVPFLRELSLAFNPLGQIKAGAFEAARTLVKLDLNDADLSVIHAEAFRGLESLEELKLAHNRIHTFSRDTFKPLQRVKSVELHENPWICDCHLRELKTWLDKRKLTAQNAICRGPESLANHRFSDLDVDRFACKPVLLLVSRYAEATIGENASIVCTVSSIPPAKIKWLWSGRALNNHSSFGSHQKVIIYEQGSFRKTSTLVLTNAQESDSSEFYCLAENAAGSVEANFTLHVSLRTAGVAGLGSGQIAGISAALLVLIVAILLTIMALFARLRRTPRKELKSPTTATVNNSSTVQVAVPTTAEAQLQPEEPPRPPPPPPAPQQNDKLIIEEEPEDVSVDNPDVIRHARANLLLAECLSWEVRRDPIGCGPSVGIINNEQFPPNARQLRVWQRSAQPVLPPVSALKRVLGSTRSSPDEGYQEGTGTDV